MNKERFIFGQAPALLAEQYTRHLRKQRGVSYPVVSERGVESVWIYEMQKEAAIENAASYIAKEIKDQSLPWYVKLSLRRYIGSKLEEIGPFSLVKALKKYLRPDELKQLGDRYPLLQPHL